MFKKINSLLLIGFLTTNVAYANDTFFPRKHEFFPNNELKNDRAVKNGQLNFVNGYSIYKDVNFSKNKYCILRFDMVDYRTIEVSQNGDCDFDNYVNVSGRYRR